MRRLLALICALSLCALPASAAAPRWIASWTAAPQPPTQASKSFNNQTVRHVVRLSAGGKRIRVRLSNAYGIKPLAIGAASVALASDKGEVTGGILPLTFGGQSSVTVPPGAPILSDPIDLAVAPLASLSVSLYLPGETGPCTCHALGVQRAFVSEPGDFTKGPFTPKESITARAFLAAVEVEPTKRGRTIVILGDSISDGFAATIDGNKRWPDRLAERLHEKFPNQAIAVANEGISGNRVWTNGMGESALTRLDRDVLSQPGVTHLVVFIGVNDVGMGSRPNVSGIPSAETMISGYRQIIGRARDRGIKVIGATIAPYEGAAYYTPQGDAVRQKVNDWIRTGREFDGVIDFDAVWRDPARPTRIRADLQAGDWLHGNDTGYRAFGDAVDLNLFR
jgi:lysophospholipase L1-like esterase